MIQFRRLLPEPGTLDLSELREALTLPADANPERPFTIANFVASADGRATLEGRSAPLSSEGDRVMFHTLRETVDAVIAGTGTAEAELKRQARRLGLTRHGSFLGWIGDDMLHSLYRVSELCIVPSIYEPFGLVALEAQACGTPVIDASVGGLRDVVAEGRTGYLIEGHDPVEYAEAIDKVDRDGDGPAVEEHRQEDEDREEG